MEINKEILKGMSIIESITLEQKKEMLKLFNGSKGKLKDIVLLFDINDSTFFQCTCGEKGFIKKGVRNYDCPKCGCNEIVDIECDSDNDSYLLGYCFEELECNNEDEIQVKITPYGLMEISLSSYNFDTSNNYWILKYNKISKELIITNYYDDVVTDISDFYLYDFRYSECAFISNNQLFDIFREIIPKNNVNEEYTLEEILKDFILQLKAPIYRDDRITGTCLKRFDRYGDLESLDEIDSYLNEIREKGVIDIDKDNLEEAFGSNDIQFIYSIKDLDKLKGLKEFDDLVVKNELEIYLDYFKDVKNVTITAENKEGIIKLCNETNVDFITMIKHIFRGINNEDLKLDDIIYSLKKELKYIEEYPIDFNKPYSSKIKGKRVFNRTCSINNSILNKVAQKPTLDTLYKALIG